jgi:hypothetical protein
MAFIAHLTPAIARLPLMDLGGSQIQMTSYQFAEFLSRYETWNLVQRCYHTGNVTLPESLSKSMLSGIMKRQKMTKIHKELMKLKDINDKWEYAMSVGYVESCEDWINITFVRDGKDFLVEFY